MTFVEYNDKVNELIDESEELISDMKYKEASDKQQEIVRMATYVKINCKEELEAVLKMINNASRIAEKLINFNCEIELAMLEMKNCPVQ